MSKFKSLIIFLTFVTLSFAFIGGDCGTQTTAPPVTVLPPSNVDLTVDAIPGGNSYALVSWDPSSDEGTSDFKGYRISTYVLDASNNILSTHSNSIVPKNTHVATINSVTRGTKFISYVSSELNDGTKSDSVATKIYGGVYYNNDGVIDEYSVSSQTSSGYGWNSSAGIGTQYAFTQSNAPAIDIHMRVQGGILKFFSPVKFLQGGKTTLFSDIDSGQVAFSKTELDDPEFDEINVVNDHVYLLKTQENNYIKVWVKRIDVVNNLNTAYFDYKVQPITNLRIVKRK